MRNKFTRLTGDDHLRTLMREYVHRDRLLGPFDAGDIVAPEARELLFDTQDRIYRQRDTNPAYVVGRRGSGKTAYLNHLELDGKYNLCIKIEKHKILSEVIKAVQGFHAKSAFVEDVADFWDSIFYTVILRRLKKKFPKLIESDEFLSNYIGEYLTLRVAEDASFFKKFIMSIAEKAKDSNDTLIGVVFSSLGNAYSDPISELRDRIDKITFRHGIKVVLLIDSLEDYNLNSEDVRRSLAGFLKSTGRFNAVRHRPEIRCCIPSELFYHFTEYSSNVGKDFNQPLVLHWRSGELLSVAARRLQLHQSLYRDGDGAARDRLLSLNPDERDDLHRFYDVLFRNHFNNEAGNAERPEVFLLRHTQALPRQVLKVLHAALKLNLQYGSGELNSVSGESLRGAVYSSSSELAKAVCNAFKYQYNDSFRVSVEFVKRLPHMFSLVELERVYQKYIKKRFSSESGYDEIQISRMLLEVGCIGIVMQETDRYLKAKFEYNSQSELAMSHGQRLCVHPMFRGVLGGGMLEPGEKPVYPIGVDPADVFR